ncbi:MAG: hypothetical protein NTZ13_00220 [Candidatus Parcubacteria bacterium]|nr:hypothetical protein [Candidatus Parcubacteria bacterium]
MSSENNLNIGQEMGEVINSYTGADFKELCSVVYAEFKNLCPKDEDEKYKWSWFVIGMIIGSCEEKGIKLRDDDFNTACEVFETHV